MILFKNIFLRINCDRFSNFDINSMWARWLRWQGVLPQDDGLGSIPGTDGVEILYLRSVPHRAQNDP